MSRSGLPIVPRPERLVQPVTFALVLGIAALIILPFDFRQALINTIIAAALTLSIIVITGFVGQMSLMQLALAGVSGYLVSHLATGARNRLSRSARCWQQSPRPSWACSWALSALRVRGVQLAVVTLAAAVAIENAWFTSNTVGGGNGGAPVPQPHLFGINLGNAAGFRGLDGQLPSPILGIGILIVTIGLCVLVANLRRSKTGQRMLAVRSNERAAAAAGINVPQHQADRVRPELVHRRHRRCDVRVQLRLGFGDDVRRAHRARLRRLRLHRRHHDDLRVRSSPVWSRPRALIPYAMQKWFGISGTWALLFGGIGVIFNLVLYPEGAAGAGLNASSSVSGWRQRASCRRVLPA